MIDRTQIGIERFIEFYGDIRRNSACDFLGITHKEWYGGYHAVFRERKRNFLFNIIEKLLKEKDNE